MRRLRWVVINGAALAFAWFGVVQGVEGAGNVLIGWAWLLVLSSAGSLLPEVQRGMAARGRTFPAWLDMLPDWLILATLTWHGWWFTAIAVLLHMVIITGTWASVEKANAKTTEVAA